MSRPSIAILGNEHLAGFANKLANDNLERTRKLYYNRLLLGVPEAAVTQLGASKAEDLEVAGSSPACGTPFHSLLWEATKV